MQANLHGYGKTSSCFQYFQQHFPNVGVVLDVNLDGEVVGEIVQLTPGGNRNDDVARPFFHREFHDIDGIVNRLNGAAEV
jgi:hypothetical protein